MRRLSAWAAALAVACLSVPAAGQQASAVVAPSGYAPVQAPCAQQADKSCKPIGTDPATGVVTGLPISRPDVAGVGTIAAATLNGAYVVPIANGQNTATMVMSGLTASGATLTLEGSNDGGTTWTNVFSPSGSTGALSNTFTADGSFSAGVAGRTRLRLRVSTAGTGTIGIASNLSAAVREVRLDAPLPPGPNTIGAVNVVTAAATSACLIGTSTGAQVVGPWSPQLGRDIYVELSGTTWPGGTAQLLRSSDGGATRLPLRPADTILGTLTGFGVDQPWAEKGTGITFYLSLPGTGISYKVCN
jgi:hypothetical protein